MSEAAEGQSGAPEQSPVELPASTLIGRTPAQRESYWALLAGALRIKGARHELVFDEGEGLPRPLVLEVTPPAGRFVPRGVIVDGVGRPEASSPDGETEPRGAVAGGAEPDAAGVEVALVLSPAWRATWGAELVFRRDPLDSHGERIAALTPRAPKAELSLSGGTWHVLVRPWVAAQGRVPERVPPGAASAERLSAAWSRATRQSTIGAWRAEVPTAERLWGEPTRPEEAPWWELDLGGELYVDRIEVRGAAEAPAGSVRVTLYSRLDEEGQPAFTEHAWRGEARFPALSTLEPRQIGRFVRVELRPDAPPAALELVGVEVLALPLVGETLLESFQRAFALYAERPLFSSRTRTPSGELSGYEEYTSYAEVWSQVQSVAAGLEAVLVDPARGPEGRVFVGICAPNQPEWVVADLACVIHGFVVVPLPTTETRERLIDMAGRAELACVFAGPAQCEVLSEVAAEVPSLSLLVQLPPADRSEPPVALSGWRALEELQALGGERVLTPAPREPEDLHTILFSSGSTGSPKGAMRSYEASKRMLTAFGVSQPPVHLSFQPLSHFSERVYLMALLVYGAQIGFATRGERLYEEFALLEPSAVAAVPRVFNLLLDRYEADLAALELARPHEAREALEEEVLESLRGVFGRRIQSVSVGSAPPSRALMRFLHRCFDFCRVGEGYGSTECATISVDDVVRPDVELRLVDVPELGYSTSDVPPRGEILVKTPHMISGYLGDEATTRANFDAEGFFRTGDLGERGEDGRVRVIGRRKNVVKLAQGEFVAPERIEGALAASPLVSQIVIHADSLQASVVALVVPSRSILAEALGVEETEAAALTGARAVTLLTHEVRSTGQAAGLLPFELPSALHIELEPLSLERGLATSSNKVDRRAVAAHYAEVFVALYAGARPAPSVLEVVRLAAEEVLGEAPALDADLAGELGVDSLSSVELVSALSARLEREIPLEAWQGATSLEELARRIQVSAGVGAAGSQASASDSSARADLEAPLDLELLPAEAQPSTAPLPERPQVLLLTGATGFLGAHLLEVLAGREDLEVRCLVRAADDAAAEERLREVAAGYRLELEWSRVVALAGDLGAPRLGWSAARWEALGLELDSILHAGAQVNWVMLYGQLRAANVRGTDTLLALAGRGRLKDFHFVSTISTAPSGGDEESVLSEERALRSTGYGLSKWVSERRVRQAGAAGLPITVYRPAMITGHSQRGVANDSDFVNRYLKTCLSLGLGLDLRGGPAGEEAEALLRCDLTPVDYVAESIVALLYGERSAEGGRGRTWHLTNLEASPTWRELSEHLDVVPVAYAEFRDALLEAGARAALAPLRAWFPAEGFRMHMGPWPNAATRSRLGELGVAPPPSARDLARVYADFHRRGTPPISGRD